MPKYQNEYLLLKQNLWKYHKDDMVKKGEMYLKLCTIKMKPQINTNQHRWSLIFSLSAFICVYLWLE